MQLDFARGLPKFEVGKVDFGRSHADLRTNCTREQEMFEVAVVRGIHTMFSKELTELLRTAVQFRALLFAIAVSSRPQRGRGKVLREEDRKRRKGTKLGGRGEKPVRR